MSICFTVGDEHAPIAIIATGEEHLGVRKTVRNYVPGLGGEYFSQDEIRSCAREHFLWAVTAVTPAPLCSLRDEILPKFQAAFEIEKRRLNSFVGVKEVSLQALVDPPIDAGVSDCSELVPAAL